MSDSTSVSKNVLVLKEHFKQLSENYKVSNSERVVKLYSRSADLLDSWS